MIRWIYKFTGLCVLCLSTLAMFPLMTHEPDATLEDYSRYITRQFVPPLHASATKRDVRCLTEAIYYEAANQSELGKEAVAMVVINRVYNKRYPKTICGVVKQSHIVSERKVCQFSYWCNEELTRPIRGAWKESKIIAERVLSNHWQRELIHTTMNKAIYYHADYVSPKWKNEKVYVGRVGNHLFYADQPNLT